jgi:pyruvate/2-oxoglutarate dehydrogenase complex dihydrolipoamide acyltransferase (E2) component
MPLSTKMILDIFDTLSVQYNFDKDEAVSMLSSKFELPKNMVQNKSSNKIVTKTNNTIFASKKAQEMADLHSFTPTGQGSGKNGTFTLIDIKNAIKKQANSHATINISPTASKFAKDNNIDISSITGSGNNGTILLKDLKDLTAKQNSKEDSKEDSKEEELSDIASEHYLESESDSESDSDQSEKSTKSDKSEKSTKSNKSDKSNKSEKSTKSQQSEKSDKSNKSAKFVPDISPKALTEAIKHGIDINTIEITGSGSDGKILLQDIKRVIANQ